MKGKIYLVTNYKTNHENKISLDHRFLANLENYPLYLVDKEIPEPLKKKSVIHEASLNPKLHLAGKKYLAEWSFLLTEYFHSFAEYPFFVVSSRFYQKNSWLGDLENYWESLFSYLTRYQWGFLPSYNRPIRWFSLNRNFWRNRISFSPFTENTGALLSRIFEVEVPQKYGYTADLFCNYIGFSNRAALVDYVEFYLPLIYEFFDQDFTLKKDFLPFIKPVGTYINEKPFTFLLELMSHLFFYKKKLPYFGLHYDGFYEILDWGKSIKKLESFSLPPFVKLRRFIDWKYRKCKSEGSIALMKYLFKKAKKKV